ncbi:MAG TPA: rhomboid family intramembrane serine protease [Caulobacteraceae bacterium]|nr:rhomboid family intramembrane serine protease [Caulobacteraceae bacterium]
MESQRERLINAPWPAVTMVAILLVCFLIQSLLGVDAVASALGFAPAELRRGIWQPLFTSLFLHGGWLHLLGNSAFGLAFATPVVRRMGEDAAGGMVFFLFFLACGVLANLGFAALAPNDLSPLVGASGAIAGLMGAASRLMTPGRGLAPFTSPPVIGMAASWLGVNLLIAFVPWATPGAGHAIVAWQAHLAGYVAGLFLIAPALRLLGRA